MSTSTETTDRFNRQASLVPRDNLLNNPVSVIGVGAIGRQVAIQLAAIGVENMQIVDFDLVEDHNMATQGFSPSDVGMAKVSAVARTLTNMTSNIRVETINDRYRARIETNPIVFCCVDSIETRKLICEKTHKLCKLFIDARMSGEVMEIYTVTPDTPSLQAYQETLFPESEGYEGSCTARSTIYTASIAAGLMVHQFTRFLRDIQTDPFISVNLLASAIYKD